MIIHLIKLQRQTFQVLFKDRGHEFLISPNRIECIYLVELFLYQNSIYSEIFYFSEISLILDILHQQSTNFYS